MLLLVLLSLFCFNQACEYKSQKYKNGDTWVVRSTFVMECRIRKNGWSTAVIGCKTPSGVIVAPGKSLKEADTTYNCVALENGRVEIKRTYDVDETKGCQGHKLGETWVSEVNFKKECTATGVQIKECLTDSGISVALNSQLALSGIVYKCTSYKNGTVIINRDKVPTKQNFELNNLRPVEVLGPLFKKHHSFRKLLVPSNQAAPQIAASQITVAPASIQKEAPMVDESVTCSSDGKTYKPEETWITDNKFTKKCTPNGSIVILNCLLEAGTTINVNSELKLGEKTYKCYRNASEGRVYFEVISA